jgi:alpha-tubulin suppressor-like RCC1 family protein
MLKRISIALTAIVLISWAAACGSPSGTVTTNSGTVYAWGYNGHGGLGDGTTTDRTTPVQAAGLTGVTAIAAVAANGGGDSATGYALKSDGTVYAWGGNGKGQLGDGTTTERHTPVQVAGLTGVTAIAAGGDGTGYALKSDGTVYAWGNHTTTDRTTPVQVSGLTGVTAIAAGSGTGYAVKSDGTVYAWGYNTSGQLGDGTTTYRTTPVQVSGLTGVTAIAAGSGAVISTGYALKSDGTVYAWGNNGEGELGDGTLADRYTPVQVSGLTGVTAIAGGAATGYALKSDGTVYAWGNHTTTDRTTPVQVSGLTGVTAIAGGDGTGFAVKSDGTVYAWGYNTSGQLGDGTTMYRRTPVQVSGLTGVTAIAAGYGTGYALKTR